MARRIHTKSSGWEFRKNITDLLRKEQLDYADFAAIEDNIRELQYIMLARESRRETAARTLTAPIVVGPCAETNCDGTNKEMYLVGPDRWKCGNHIHDSAIGNPKRSAVCFRIGRDGITGSKMKGD